MTGQKIKIELTEKEIREFKKFRKHQNDFIDLENLNFFDYKKLGAGCVTLHWNSAGQIKNLKNLNYVDPKIKKFSTENS